ncbi:MAG: acyl carrier protein [Planctomycetota bacterium]|nr:acyl carrier protein [Planctomycetota bacterium]
MSDTTASILDRVVKIVCDQMDKTADQIKPETDFVQDLGADSLDTVELVMCLEEEFEVTIPDEDADKIRTVGAAVSYIESKL